MNTDIISGIINNLNQGDIVDRNTIITMMGYPLDEKEYKLKQLQVKSMIETSLFFRLGKSIYIRCCNDDLRILTDKEAFGYAEKVGINLPLKKKIKAYNVLTKLDITELTPEEKEVRKLNLSLLANEIRQDRQFRLERKVIKDRFNPHKKPVLPPFIDTSSEDELIA